MPTTKALSSPYRVTLSPARCSLDLGDGSERGEYVDQDYVLRTLGRPHRAVSLMYCYWPFSPGWPKRASVAHKNKGKHAWGYPYDDYFPFTGGPKGDPESGVFQQMRDIRRHGQDVTLTMTMDCKVPDDHIRVIARQLRPYGNIRLRLNHECDGYWFNFNKKYSYDEVGRFFVRFAGVMKREAPNVKVICCWGHVEDHKTGRLRAERELAPTLEAADVWSADHYLTLHYGWPFHPCEPEHENKYFKHTGLREVWEQMEGVHRRFVELTGTDKGLELGELNSDGDVGGELSQSKLTESFYRKVLKDKPSYLKGITFYQFRDRGRLGLELECPNNAAHGSPTPFLDVYRDLLQEPYFLPKEAWTRLKGGLRMDWRSSEDSDGLGWKVSLRSKPLFLELLFDKKDNLMVRVGKRWFYKRPGVERVDATTEAASWGRSKPLPIMVFAPPASGMNPGNSSHVATRLSKPPKMRLLYKW